MTTAIYHSHLLVCAKASDSGNFSHIFEHRIFSLVDHQSDITYFLHYHCLCRKINKGNVSYMVCLCSVIPMGSVMKSLIQAGPSCRSNFRSDLSVNTIVFSFFRNLFVFHETVIICPIFYPVVTIFLRCCCFTYKDINLLILQCFLLALLKFSFTGGLCHFLYFSN